MTWLRIAVIAMTLMTALAAVEPVELARATQTGAILPLEMTITVPDGGDYAVWVDSEQSPEGFTMVVHWPEAAKVSHHLTGQAVLPPGEHQLIIDDRWDRGRSGDWILAVRALPDPDGGEADAADAPRAATAGRQRVVLWPAAESDWFTLQSPGAGYWYARLQETPRGFTPWISFIDDSDQLLGINQARVGAAGTIRARIQDRWGNFGSLEPLTVDFQFVSETDSSEPNDSRETARPIEANTPFETAIALPGEQDWLRLDVDDSVYLRIDHLGEIPGFTPWHDVYDADGRLIGRNHARVDLPGTIYIRLMDRWGNYQNSTPFPLQVTTTPVDDFLEPNDLPAQATLVETHRWFHMAIAPAGDVDHFRITSPSPGIVVPRVENPPDHLEWAVVDPETGGVISGYPLQVAAGESIIRASIRWNGSPGYDPFRVRFDWFPADDAHEPNDDIPVEVALGETVRFRIPTGADIDRFRIHCDRPGLLQITPLGQLPIALTFSHGEGTTALSGNEIVIPVDQAGPVDFAVQGAEGAWSVEPLRFTSAMIEPLDPGEPNDSQDRATPLPIGGEAVFSINPDSDVDWFRLPVGEDLQPIVLELTDATIDQWQIPIRAMEFLILDPEGTTFAHIPGHQFSQPAGGAIFPALQPSITGDYLLRITGPTIDADALRIRRHGTDAGSSDGSGSMVVMGVELVDGHAATMRALASDQGGAYVEAETADAIDTTFEKAVELAVEQPPEPEANPIASRDAETKGGSPLALIAILVFLGLIILVAILATVLMRTKSPKD